jgi:formate hydrogenlyase subunit 3/multisubunit Na+/H+ antiporter MnhD subunit
MNLIALFLVLLANINLSILNLFLLVHGLLSALFFFLVDQVQKQFGSRNSILVSGLAVFTPLLVLAIWLGLLIFRGFPIFVKFFVE